MFSLYSSSGIRGFQHPGLPLTQLMPQQQPEYAPVPSMQVAGQIRGQLSGVIQQQLGYSQPQCGVQHPPHYYASTEQQQSYLPQPSGDQSKGMQTERSESLLLLQCTDVRVILIDSCSNFWV